MSEERPVYPVRTWSVEEFNPRANPFVIPLVRRTDASKAAYWEDRYETEHALAVKLELQVGQLLADRSEQAQEIIRQLKEKKELADQLRIQKEGSLSVSNGLLDTISELREKLETLQDIKRAYSALLEKCHPEIKCLRG